MIMMSMAVLKTMDQINLDINPVKAIINSESVMKEIVLTCFR